MSQEACAQITKESIQQDLRDKNLQCRYYEAIVNTTTDLIALTDGTRIIDANKSLVEFCESIDFDITDKESSFASLFEPIQKFGYIYEGYQERSWVENVLKGEKSDHRVGIIKEGALCTFNLTLRSLEFFQNIYVMTLSDVTEMMGYKTTLEEGIKSSVKDRDKTEFLLHQYDKAMEAATLVFKCDTNGVITFTNRALCETFLYASGELVGKHFSILRGDGITDAMYIEIWERVKQGKIYRGVLELSDKLGGSRYLDVSFIPIISQEGEIIEFFSLSHEITEVMVAKELAIKTLEAKNKFFDQVSHELRTPLNAIINFTDQALENFDEMQSDEETRDLVQMYIERSHKNSQHLLHLINSLLDMAKLRAGKEKYEMVSTDVVFLARDVYEATSGLNTKVALEYLLEIPSTPLYIQCDELRMRQILTNLISNAIKFTEWGYVRLRVYEEQGECWIDVDDTGIGIPENKLESIFEPFEQVGAHDQGTGLGLGIVNEYVKAMGMRMDVSSIFGEGSCFTLKISVPEVKEPQPQENEVRAIGAVEHQVLRESFVVKIPAAEYVASIDSDAFGEVSDLREAELEWTSWLHTLEHEGSEENFHYFANDVLGAYSNALGALSMLLKTNGGLLASDDEKRAKVLMFLEGFKNDMSSWIEHVFVLQDTQDIHYLDGSFFSSCMIIESIVTGVDVDTGDEGEIEFF